ncbi:hypothetical protein J2X68_006413 [Streptomyces sp. 3330]|uniref:hypothetical protein n=1 Tax=Streptomyces sp. 3330 TaxID=2817755 RepID=UPI002854C532|nr:hypothetical protein [Streptomyces sp. 3330]
MPEPRSSNYAHRPVGGAWRPEARCDGRSKAASNPAEMLLRMLGLPPQDAHDVARRPLPDLG